MGFAGRAGAGRVGGVRGAALAMLVGLTAAGCATLPSSGPVTKVQEGDEGAAQVQVWPSPPNGGDTPTQIVGGFLEAASSGASNQRIAADYLTPAMQKQWQSDQNTVIVLADYSESPPQSPSSSTQQGTGLGSDGYQDTGSSGYSGAGETLDVLGTVIGRLAREGLYSAESDEGDFEFTVEATKSGYRISQLPKNFGVLMERSDFESSYSRHAVYYENPQQSAYFVPTEIYLPAVENDDEVAEQMAKLIVSSVPTHLAPALENAMDGAQFEGLDLEGGGGATVTIKSNGACAKSLGPCDRLAEELAQSLGGLSPKVGTVAVRDETSGLSTAQYSPQTGVAEYGLEEQGRAIQNPNFYAVSSDGTLESISSASGDVTQPAISVVGSSKVKFKQVAVAPGSSENGGELPEHLALLGSDGYSVYVAHRQDGTETATDVFPGSSAIQPGGTVGRLAWNSAVDTDGGGALWFTYTLNHETSLYRYYGGELSQVTVTGLAGRTIEGVAPAPDGDRVAIGYLDGQGHYSISIAAAVSEPGGDLSVDLGESDSEVVAAAWSSVTGFDWYNEDSLAVLGLPPSAQELGLYQLYADGSPVYDTLTVQPVQASPPSQADGFVWNTGGQPIAAALSQGKDALYTLSVEGQDAQRLSGAYGTSPSY